MPSRPRSPKCSQVDRLASLTALLLFAGCAAPGDEFAPDPPGGWFAGDVHVHAAGASNDAGEDSTPAAIREVARARGLDFVVLSDHSNSAGSDPTTREEDPALFNQGPEMVHWDEAARLSEPGRFVMVSGNELSPVADPPNEPRGHIGCLPATLEGFDVDSPFVDRPKSAVTGGSALAQARNRGCFTVVNHPFAQVAWLRYDWTDMGYDAIEVFNGGLGFDAGDQEAYDAWRCDLLAGRAVTPIAASDNHRVHVEAPGRFLDSALGYPKTEVFAERLDWPSLIDGLRAGRVALSDGASRVQLDAYDADRAAAEGGAVRWIRLRGRLDPAARVATLTLWHATRCDDPRPRSEAPILEQSALFRRAVQGGDGFDEAIAVDGAAGVYTATLLVEDGRYTALSAAHVVP